MIGFKQVIASAFVFSAAMSSVAYAQSTAEKTKVPATVSGTPGPETTDSRNLDQNAQRAHGGAGVADGKTDIAAVNAATAPAEGSRYWEKYDTNKNHLMEPTEIEAILKDSKSKPAG